MKHRRRMLRQRESAIEIPFDSRKEEGAAGVVVRGSALLFREMKTRGLSSTSLALLSISRSFRFPGKNERLHGSLASFHRSLHHTRSLIMVIVGCGTTCAPRESPHHIQSLDQLDKKRRHASACNHACSPSNRLAPGVQWRFRWEEKNACF